MRSFTTEECKLLDVIIENIMTLRERSGISKICFAKKTGIPRKTIWNYEQKKRVPSVWLMHCFSGFFRVHMIELILSSDRLLDVLSDDVERHGLCISDEVGLSRLPDFDYERAMSNNLRIARKQNNLTLKELEGRLESVISFATISRYERENVPIPIRLIVPMASALGMSPLEFMTPREYFPDVLRILARKYEVFETSGEMVASAFA